MARGSIHRTARETHPPHGDARETINRNARETHRTARETHRAATRETINRNARETIDRNARETINRNARETHRAALRPGFPSVTPGWCVRSRRSRLRRCMISSRFARFWERRAAPGAIRTPARGDSGNPGVLLHDFLPLRARLGTPASSRMISSRSALLGAPGSARCDSHTSPG